VKVHLVSLKHIQEQLLSISNSIFTLEFELNQRSVVKIHQPVLPIKTKEQLNFLFLCSLIKEAIIENKQLKSFE
jgi:hypothetical protein